MDDKASVQIRIAPKTHSKLKIFAAKKRTTFDGAVEMLLKQGAY